MAYLFVFIAVIVVVVIIVRSVRSTSRQEKAAFQAFFGDATEGYRCMICDSATNQYSEYDERCPSCGYSTKRVYRGVLKERVSLITDVNSAMSYFNEAVYCLTRASSSEPDWSGYITALEQGTSLIYGGFSKTLPLAEALRAVGEPEFAAAVEQMKSDPGEMASRADRHLALLKLAKAALAKDVQRRLKSEGTVPTVDAGQKPHRRGAGKKASASRMKAPPPTDAPVTHKTDPSPPKKPRVDAPSGAGPVKTTPPPIPVAPRRDDAEYFLQTVFGEDVSSVDAENRFLEYQGREVRWQGTLQSVTPFSFDFDFDEAPGVKAEVLLKETPGGAGLVNRYIAAVRFPPENVERLQVSLNRPIAFSGKLLKLNASGLKVFIKTGKLLHNH